MNGLTLSVNRVFKDFNRRSVLRDISFSVSPGESLAITGKNGSGKSTLVKILSGVLSPTRGTIQFTSNGKALDEDEVRPRIGMVSPYLQMYDEFTAFENLELLSKIRDEGVPQRDRMEALFRQFNLWQRKDDMVRTFSSGMKQRLKYIIALTHGPGLLLLDEPTANLDDEGTSAVRDIVAEQEKSALLVVATNEEHEAAWCKKRIHLG